MLEQLASTISRINIPMIYDNGLIMAIIAINMTIIGLTSLADQKCVIGVDYGRFLITKFKVAGMRMYYLIIAFALVNIASLFLMFIENPIIRLANFILLIISLTFAIFYFFGFIIVENNWVKKQIYMSELLGLYFDDANIDHAALDKLVKMNPGNKTNNKLSTNVVNYFNIFNGDTQKVFKEIVGPNSIIYSDEPKIVNYRKRNLEENQSKRYQYRVSESNENIKDISFEFFQLFRDSEMQDKWAIDILYLMNGETESVTDGHIKVYREYEIIRLYNLARVMMHVDVFASAENVFKYKFLTAMSGFLFSTVYKSKEEENKGHIAEVERYMLNSLVTHFVKSIMKDKDLQVISCIQDMLNHIVIENKYRGYLEAQEVVKVFIEVATKLKCQELQDIIETSLTLYKNEANKKVDIKVGELAEYAKIVAKGDGNQMKRVKLWHHNE